MTRLPVTGKDEGTWGDLLNTFLLIEHNSDGTLRRGTDIDAALSAAGNALVQIADVATIAATKYNRPVSGIPTTDLAANVQAAITKAEAAIPVIDASGNAKGIMQLAGDLAGTANAPAVKARQSLTVGGAGTDFPVANYATFSHAVNAALAALTGYGEVIIQADTYQVPATGSVAITPVSGATVRGAGIGKTIIQTLRTDYVFKTSSGVTDFSVQDLTIDCQNATNVNAMQILDSTRFVCRNVQFLRSAKWFVKLGSEPSGTTTNCCSDCVFDRCIFDTHSSIYEMLLIYNTKNTVVSDCVFQNGAAGSPTLGLWQKTDNTHIVRCQFKDCASTALYYAITCNNTYIENCTFDNCASGILGGNVPDNGLFGTTHLFNLHVNRNHFKGGANSAASAAVQFGAVNGCYAEGNVVESYQRGFTFTYGNQTGSITAPYPSMNGLIRNNTFKNINPVGSNPAIANPLFLSNSSGSGIIFSGNKVVDDQTTHTNINCVSFNSAGASYSNVKFIDNDFPVDVTQTSLGPASIKVNDSCTVDATVLFQNSHNFTNPAGGIQGASIKSLKGLYIRDGVLGISSGETINTNTDLQIGNGSAVTTFRQNNVQEKNSNDNMQRIWPNFTGKTEVIYKANTNASSQRSKLDIDTGVYTANGFDANLATDVSTGGIVVKRLTTAQRDAIVGPQTGTIIWNTTTTQFEQFNGTSWGALAPTGAATALVDTNGNSALSTTATAGAVSGLNVTNAVSGGTVTLAVSGTGANSPFLIKGQGTGQVVMRPGTNNTSALKWQDAAGASTVLCGDTTNIRLAVGGTTPTSVLDVRGAIATPVTTKNAAYTLTTLDSTITADATSSPFTLTLPTAIGIPGRTYVLKKTDNSANAVTVATTASQTIDGTTSYVLVTQWKFVRVQSDGANWLIVGNN